MYLYFGRGMVEDLRGATYISPPLRTTTLTLTHPPQKTAKPTTQKHVQRRGNTIRKQLETTA
ncbi:hypothetical protein ACSS6W_001150 [Trichoderma asperelloides]